jgi:hypothetical protein
MWLRRGYPAPCDSVGEDEEARLSLPLLAERQRRRVDPRFTALLKRMNLG